MSFLNAEWRKLAIANYVVDASVLQKYVPYKTELDIWEGKCYVSLVGFMFLNTKTLGVKIPFHVNFEEVNLRFYVRYKDGLNWKRGVVFIKELVPRMGITFVANTFYKEHYQTVPMNHFWKESDEQLEIQYSWKINKREYFIHLTAKNELTEIPIDSEAEFITEHYWGYTRIKGDKTFEYEVKHPRWQFYEVINHKIEIDFEAVYGSEFKSMNQQQPSSVMLFEGSEVSVEKKRTL